MNLPEQIEGIRKIAFPPKATKENLFPYSPAGYQEFNPIDLTPESVNDPNTTGIKQSILEAGGKIFVMTFFTSPPDYSGAQEWEKRRSTLKASLHEYTYKLVYFQEWRLTAAQSLMPGESREVSVTYKIGTEESKVKTFMAEAGFEVTSSVEGIFFSASATLSAKFGYESSNSITLTEEREETIKNSLSNTSDNVWYYYIWQLVQGVKIKRFHLGKFDGELGILEDALDPPVPDLYKE